MDIKLTSDIKDLLIEDGSISIPNFGGFTSAYKPAVVDAMNGQLAPPSFHIAFDANLQMNDGRLVDHIRQKYRLSSTAAFEYIEAFANDARSNFEKGEIVVLPEIGRLYRDFAQKIQFLPDPTNFNTDSFGLPSINYSPVLRNKVESIARATSDIPQSSAPPIVTTPPQQTPPLTVTPPVVAPQAAKSEPLFNQNTAATTPETPAIVESLAGRQTAAFPSSMDAVKPPIASKSAEMMEKVRENWRTWLPIAAVVGILSILVWQLNESSKPILPERFKKTHPAEQNVNTSPLQDSPNEPNVNVSPPVDGANTPSAAENPQASTTITSPDMLSGSPRTETSMNREPNLTLSEGANHAVVLLGGFGDKRNIQRNKAWITQKGFTVLERKNGGLTILSCEFNYQKRSDLQKAMRTLRGKFGEEITLIKK
jgi:CCDC81-like prokaryotic HU domain 2/CCDC81-like prokaryotic HU domain 1